LPQRYFDFFDIGVLACLMKKKHLLSLFFLLVEVHTAQNTVVYGVRGHRKLMPMLFQV
jgi:hypothetical protein